MTGAAPDDRLTAEELAAMARCSPARIRQLADLGLLATRDGRYTPGDVHRIRLIESFGAAGVPVEALAGASRGGAISFAYYDQLHRPPGPPTERTYGELLAGLGDRAPLLRRLVAGFGIAEPEPEDQLEQEDERLLLAALETIEANRDQDLAIRASRLLAEAARRGAEAAMSVYAEAVERSEDDVAGVVSLLAGVPPPDVFERFLEPWARLARLAPELTGWLAGRHLSVAIDTWSVAETERLLAATGFVPPRASQLPAISFIDLTGFTRLSEERGDRAAAAIATEFMVVAGDVAEASGGRVVKQLGDGVLLRFDGAPAAVDATLDVLEQLAQADLPGGHAGVAAGPVIVRDGDVFGRTVNLAARIADRAADGELLAPAELAGNLPPDRYRVEPAGEAGLQGIAAPQALARIRRLAASGS